MAGAPGVHGRKCPASPWLQAPPLPAGPQRSVPMATGSRPEPRRPAKCLASARGPWDALSGVRQARDAGAARGSRAPGSGTLGTLAPGRGLLCPAPGAATGLQVAAAVPAGVSAAATALEEDLGLRGGLGYEVTPKPLREGRETSALERGASLVFSFRAMQNLLGTEFRSLKSPRPSPWPGA